MNRILPLLLSVLLCHSAAAELNVEVKKAGIQRIITPKISTQLLIGGVLVGKPVIGEGVSTEDFAPAQAIFVKSDKDLTKSLVRLKCETASAKMVETGLYVIDTPGTHKVEVNVIAWGEPPTWEDEVVTVVVGEPTPPPTPPEPPAPPEPPTPPAPDVPADEFDNLGQRVAEWAVGLPDLKVLSSIYREYAERMLSDETETITSLSVQLVAAVSALPNAASYTALRNAVNADLTARWDSFPPNRRLKLSEYYLAIAAGLEGVVHE